MNVQSEQYRQLVAYNRWANNRALSQIKTFPQLNFEQKLGGSFPSLQLTLIHLLESDWIWLNRWQGKPFVTVPTSWNTSTAVLIASIWQGIQQQIEQSLNMALAESATQLIQFKTKRGEEFSMPLWQTIHHTVNHGTYHRGQLANMIRMIGHKPLATDLFIFYNEENNRFNNS